MLVIATDHLYADVLVASPGSRYVPEREKRGDARRQKGLAFHHKNLYGFIDNQAPATTPTLLLPSSKRLTISRSLGDRGLASMPRMALMRVLSLLLFFS